MIIERNEVSARPRLARCRTDHALSFVISSHPIGSFEFASGDLGSVERQRTAARRHDGQIKVPRSRSTDPSIAPPGCAYW
jgi:hypothetical protein